MDLMDGRKIILINHYLQIKIRLNLSIIMFLFTVLVKDSIKIHKDFYMLYFIGFHYLINIK
jgi:hypothetical protein